MKISNSKKQLAKVINENGGWPERALWAVQDNCIAFFLGGKPEYKSGDRCWYSNCLDGACVGTITCDEKVTNWHQTVLSREEYYQAYPMTDDDGWVEWNGGECPVCGDDDVEVVMVDGSTDHGIADEFDWHRDGGHLSVASYRLRNADVGGWINWNGGECPVGDGVLIDVKKVDGSTEFAVHDPQDRIWGDTDHRKCIIAYRLHKPEVKPELCESVMRSIPEPEFDDAGSRLAKALELVKSAAPHMLRDKYKFDGNEVMGVIDTLEGKHIVTPGDWIIKGVSREFYPCKPDIFAATYEAVGDATTT